MCPKNPLLDDLFLRIYDNGSTDTFNYQNSGAQCQNLPYLVHINEGASISVVQHKQIIYCSPDMGDEKGKTSKISQRKLKLSSTLL